MTGQKFFHFLGFSIVFLSASLAHAGHLTVIFKESAPKDSFTIRNDSQCHITDVSVTLDLKGSKAGLYFDTSEKGVGVNVYQPLEIAQGKDLLRNTPSAKDGDRAVSLQFNQLAPKDAFVMTIDVDDEVSKSPEGPTMISGAEIENASVTLNHSSQKDQQALFNQDGWAIIMLPDCETALLEKDKTAGFQALSGRRIAGGIWIDKG